MAITYEQAREAVRHTTEPDWPFGTYCLDDRQIVENDSMYVFEVGAREYIVDGDDSVMAPGSVPVVYKDDGRVEWLPSVAVATDDSFQVRPNPSPTLEL